MQAWENGGSLYASKEWHPKNAAKWKKAKYEVGYICYATIWKRPKKNQYEFIFMLIKSL